ncbi:hypothetical protein [Streptomyces sp. NPDC048442]|uniref:hypothetical protein n=1 Tax=Streptomyces sp. NPDC048442 TaxID=3154823 RepID=UPI0034471692
MPGKRRLSRPLQSFVEELALCVAINGDVGPSLLWPDAAATLPALRRIPRPQELGPGSAAAPGGPGAAALTSALSDRLGLSVTPRFRALAPGSAWTYDVSGSAERTVTVLEGACRCDLLSGSPVGRTPPPAPHHPLGMRLRSGSTLFTPRHGACRLSEVHTPTVLLELVLEDRVRQ